MENTSNFKRKYIRVSKKSGGYHIEYNFTIPSKNGFIFGNYLPKNKTSLLNEIKKATKEAKNLGIKSIYLRNGKKTKEETLSPLEEGLINEIVQEIKKINENLIVKKQ